MTEREGNQTNRKETVASPIEDLSPNPGNSIPLIEKGKRTTINARRKLSPLRRNNPKGGGQG